MGSDLQQPLFAKHAFDRGRSLRLLSTVIRQDGLVTLDPLDERLSRGVPSPVDADGGQPAGAVPLRHHL